MTKKSPRNSALLGKAKLFTAITVTAYLVSGCGGSSAVTPPLPSPFAGMWSGTYNVPSNGQAGTENVTITSAGAVTGTGHNNNTGTDFSISGTLANDGTFTGSIAGTPPITASGTWMISPTTGHLTGTTTATSQGGSQANTFDLTKVLV